MLIMWTQMNKELFFSPFIKHFILTLHQKLERKGERPREDEAERRGRGRREGGNSHDVLKSDSNEKENGGAE